MCLQGRRQRAAGGVAAQHRQGKCGSMAACVPAAHRTRERPAAGHVCFRHIALELVAVHCVWAGRRLSWGGDQRSGNGASYVTRTAATCSRPSASRPAPEAPLGQEAHSFTIAAWEPIMEVGYRGNPSLQSNRRQSGRLVTALAGAPWPHSPTQAAPACLIITPGPQTARTRPTGRPRRQHPRAGRRARACRRRRWAPACRRLGRSWVAV